MALFPITGLVPVAPLLLTFMPWVSSTQNARFVVVEIMELPAFVSGMAQLFLGVFALVTACPLQLLRAGLSSLSGTGNFKLPFQISNQGADKIPACVRPGHPSEGLIVVPEWIQ